MLMIENAVVRYGGITAINNVSIKVGEGETILLIGANGAGKSTIINAVIGLVPLSHGRMTLNGNSLLGLSADRRAHAGIGYSPEGRQVFPRLSVRDNVLTGAFGRGVRYQRESFDWLASIFPLLAERASHPAGQLSGGQQQVVALARAMSASPKLLLLDEPFLGLAPVWIEQISRAIQAAQQRGMTLLMTEQMARPALKLATRGYVLRGGEVRREGSVAQIKEIALAEEYL